MKPIQEWNKYGLMAMLLVANAAFFALMAWLLPLQYEENDDIMMCMIANGSYSGTPDFHLVYINVIYGRVLVWLYGLTKAIEWYTLSFAVLHILSMSVLVYCLVTTPKRARWEQALWLGILYVLWARIIVSLQFTTTAGLVCLAGSVLLMRSSWQSQWTGVVMVLTAALVRFMAAGLVGLLMAPIVLYTHGLHWRRYIPIVVMLMLVVGCRVVNSRTYQSDPEWKMYREYNQLRAQLNDNPNAYTPEIQEHLPGGIDKIDYILLLRFFPDPEQINLEAIRQLSAAVGSVPFSMQLKNVHRLDKYAVELSILLIILALMIMTTGNKRKYLFLLLYSLFVIILIVYVSLDGFLKNRVFLCMLLPILFTDFMLLPNTTGRKRKYALCTVMLLLSGWYIWKTAEAADNNYDARISWRYFDQPLLECVPDSAYVITMGTCMNIKATNPWQVWPYKCHKYTLGWMTWIPFNTAVASSYRGLMRDDMYVFTTSQYDRPRTIIPRVREQIQKHYGLKTEIERIKSNELQALIQIRAVAERDVD